MVLACLSLELQAGFAGGVGQRLDPPVVRKPAAVDHDRRDPPILGRARDELAHFLGRGHVAAALQLALQVLVQGRGAADRLALVVVDDLGVDVALAAEGGEARPLGRALDLLPDPVPDPLPDVLFGLDLHLILAGRSLRSVTAGVPVLVTSRLPWLPPCPPSSSGPRPRSGSPSACTGRACGGRGSPPPPAPPSAGRCRRRSPASACPPRSGSPRGSLTC